MVEIGKYNRLRVKKKVDFGIYLDGGDYGEILMPKRYVIEEFDIDNTIEAFIYNDSEDRLIATTEKPLAIVGEFACLKVVSICNVGAFLEWGLPKDLLVPFSEQKQTMVEGNKYLVYVFLDKESQRIVASAKLAKFLDNIPPNYLQGEEVDIIISEKTDIGFKAIINSLHQGLIYRNEVFCDLEIGQRLKAYIVKVRDDEKIDLILDKPGFGKIDGIAGNILDKLAENNGFLPYSDKSGAEEIYKVFGISKKNFKKSIGTLFKRRLIIIEDDGIRTVPNDRS